MNVRQHAFLARALQDACGGVDACLKILLPTPFRMRQTHLYDCRDPATPRTMPAGAIAILEAHQKFRIYSASLLRQCELPSDAVCALDEACEASEDMVAAQRLVRLALADGEISENEKREIEPVLQRVERRLAGIRTAMDRGAALSVAA